MSRIERGPTRIIRVVAFPPLIWLINAVISVLVHLFIRLPIIRYSMCLVCGVVATSFWRGAGAVGLTNNEAAEQTFTLRAALTIVRDGPFRFTGNPMYLALCLVQVALGFFLNDWITLLFVVPLALILHYGVVLREERYLTAKFGEPYLQYKRDVRRWI
jgi:protein-S-isoprenylcysteine O-methyltransferase Ste14